MSQLSNLPLKVVAPAAATALAYLNARWSLWYDIDLIKSLSRSLWRSRAAERAGRLNLFYALEHYALASATADCPFIVYGGSTWSFHEVYQLTLRYGAWLKRAHNVKPKEIVALDFMNSSSFVFLILGLWSIGAVPALINYNLSGKPLTHCVRVSTARLLIVDEEVNSAFPASQLETFSSPNFRDGKGSVEVIFFNSALDAQIVQTSASREDDEVRGSSALRDMALLIYTSGTTGLPKPAIVSWKKCWSASIFVGSWLSLSHSDRFFTCMPLYHSSAAILGFIACLMSSSTLVIGRKFSAKGFWRDARENNVTVVQYVGETLRYLLAVPPDIDSDTGEDLDKKHNVRIAFGNGLRPDIWNQVKERFNIPTIAEFYAATEGTSGSWNLSSNDFTAGAIGRNGALGDLIIGRSSAIVEVDYETEQPWRDPQTGLCKRVPRGEPRELLYAIDANDPADAFQGYFQNSKATEGKILRNVNKKGDAYFRTGDTVRWDKDGRWYFSDRIGDTFRWKSENVSTSEVSEVLGAHPEIHEANVYGVALPNHDGRAGCAAVVLEQQIKPGNISTEIDVSVQTLDSLAAYVLKNLPKYALPLFLRMTPEMQATGNNKQQKHTLRAEGVDPSAISPRDKLYWLKGDRYVPFEHRDWDSLKAGQVKL